MIEMLSACRACLRLTARRPQPHVVLVNPVERLIEAELRAVVLLDDTLETHAVGLDLVPDTVRLGLRIADSIRLGRGSHANADAHRTEREDRDVAATSAGPVEDPHVAARGEHRVDPSNSAAVQQRQSALRERRFTDEAASAA